MAERSVFAYAQCGLCAVKCAPDPCHLYGVKQA